MAITINGTNGLTTDNGALKLDTDTLVVDDTNNRVGIGTSSPSEKLQINAGAVSSLLLGNSDGVGHGYRIRANVSTTVDGGFNIEYNDGTDLYRVDHDVGSGFHAWYMGGAERMRIDSSGTFFVGTTATNASDGGFVVSAVGTIAVGNSAGSSGHEFATFRRSGTQIGSITQSGTTGVSYNTSSDYRLKENVVEITDGIDRVKLLNPSRFNFISDSDTTVDGFLAHEAQAVVPEAVTGTHDEVDDNGNPVMQGIDQSKLVPLLTAALQDSIAKIEALEARVTALENA